MNIDPGLKSFYAFIDKTVEKLKSHKGNDCNSMRRLKEKITNGGNDFQQWMKQYESNFTYNLSSSLICTFIKTLHRIGFIHIKPPRETDRYKPVLHAWIQNYWKLYSSIFENVHFIHPHAQVPIPSSLQTRDEVYQYVTEKLLRNEISYENAANLIWSVEKMRSKNVHCVAIINFESKLFLMVTEVNKKKHVVIESKYIQKNSTIEDNIWLNLAEGFECFDSMEPFIDLC